MASDVRCDVCGRAFEHEWTGPAVRCPFCQMTIQRPADGGSAIAAAQPAGSSDLPSWHVYTCDGQRYGPITKGELDRWAEEKRLTVGCQVYQDGWPAWQMAPELYPRCRRRRLAAWPCRPPRPNIGPAQSTASGSQNPYAAPRFAGDGGARPYQLPHRGALILALGILGWVICCVFSLPAIIMGQADLQKMRSGEMDNSGYGMTMAGMVLGIVLCVLFVVMLIFAAITRATLDG